MSFNVFRMLASVCLACRRFSESSTMQVMRGWLIEEVHVAIAQMQAHMQLRADHGPMRHQVVYALGLYRIYSFDCSLIRQSCVFLPFRAASEVTRHSGAL